MSGPVRILLVEDNEGDVEMTQRALRDGKPECDLAVANDGIAALEYLAKSAAPAEGGMPRLILLDLNMPRMDGKRFLESVKADPHLKAIPVVMLTSSESPADIRACYERQASCYVVKPFDGREFANAVRQIVTFWGTLARPPA